MSNVLDSFLVHNCPEIEWSFSGSSQFEVNKKLQLNYTTDNKNTREVLECIRAITGKIPIRTLQCMNGPIFSSVLYHLKCQPGCLSLIVFNNIYIQDGEQMII
jgi:hypothetical protein